MGAYSKDLRIKALAAARRGTSRREVVKTFGKRRWRPPSEMKRKEALGENV